ncbi:hypothetical protein BC831DRAFT_475185 [Entophlyctis helioformis]|nr:hypothetical protein BC831DRAFT_475185 [Entophlyctis helioformis]
MVRQSNFADVFSQQAAVIITPTMYDKRALTTTDPKALANSLLNLSYMTSLSTTRTAAMLSADGAIELLVRILVRLAPRQLPKHQHAAQDPTGQPLRNAAQADHLARLSYSAALACLSNLAVRGSMALRFRLVDAGVVPALLPLLQTAAASVDRTLRPPTLAMPSDPVQASVSHRTAHADDDASRLAAAPAAYTGRDREAQQHQPYNHPQHQDEQQQQQHPQQSPSAALESVYLAAHTHTHETRQSQHREPETSWPTVAHARGDSGDTGSSTLAAQDMGMDPGAEWSMDRQTHLQSPPHAHPLADAEGFELSGVSMDTRPDLTSATIGAAPIAQQPHSPVHEHDARAATAATDFFAVDAGTATATVALGVHARLPLNAQGFPMLGVDQRFHQQQQHQQQQQQQQQIQGLQPLFPTIQPLAAGNAIAAPAAEPMDLLTATNRALQQQPVMPPRQDQRPMSLDQDVALAAMSAMLGPDFRSEDLLLATKLIAYVSKYHDIRQALHTTYGTNVYSLIERLTSLHVPMELRKWATVCMRNCFKRDGQPKSLRRCGHLRCGKMESHRHEFSKCSRCRRVTYCSKSCQRSGWSLHRNWCLPFEASSTAAGAHSTDDTHAPLAGHAAFDLSAPQSQHLVSADAAMPPAVDNLATAASGDVDAHDGMTLLQSLDRQL